MIHLTRCLNGELGHLMKLPKIDGDTDRSQLNKLDSRARFEELTQIAAQPNNLTWFEMKEKQYFKEQDEQYMPIIKEIGSSLKDIKKKLNELMKVNAERDELAKLKEAEFYLDLEELDRLNKEADGEISKIRERVDLENLGKMYLRETIKKECWDAMRVKGQGIQAFNNNLLVENYALKERSREETGNLERCKMLRRIELASQKARAELTSEIMKRDNINDLVC